MRAFNSDGLKKAHSTVVVDDRPVIQDFASTKMRIQEGEEAVLYWTADFADEVSITPGKNEDLETTGTLAVSPIRSTYYTLTATNLHGSILTV